MDLIKKKICQAVMKDELLTKESLIRLGINDGNISELEKIGALILENDGTYVVSADCLYDYAVSMIDLTHYGRINACFVKCLEIEPNHYRSILRMFLACIRQKDFVKAYEWLDRLYELGGDFEKVANLYLYLLGSFTMFPEEYKLKFELRFMSLTADNMGLIDSDVVDDQIVARIVDGERHKLLNDGNTLEENILKHLLYFSASPFKATVSDKGKSNYEYSLLKLVFQRDYAEAREVLARRKNISGDEYLSYCLKVIEDIIKIISSGELPKCDSKRCTKTFEAIDNKNYNLALVTNLYYCKVNGIFLDNLLCCLLFDINELMGSVTSGKKINFNVGEERVTISHMIKFFEQGDYIRFFSMLRRYLVSIGESEKFDLVCYFAELSLLKNDSRGLINNCLIRIISGEYLFDYNVCLERFNKKFNDGNYKEAEVSLKILRTGGDFPICSQLERQLLEAKACAGYPRDGQVRYNGMDDCKRASILGNYNKFLRSYSIYESLYNEISRFMDSDSRSIFLKYDLSDLAVERIISSLWYSFSDESLDIKVFNGGSESLICLRKVNSVIKGEAWGEFSTFEELVEYLFVLFNEGNFSECINRISGILLNSSFAFRQDAATIEIFLILIKSYLFVSSTDMEDEVLYQLLENYLRIAYIINSEKKLGYSEKISDVSDMIKRAKIHGRDNLNSDSSASYETKEEIAESHAYSIYYSGIGIDDYLPSICNDVDYETILFIKVSYAANFAESLEEQKRLFDEVSRDVNVTNEVLVFLESVKGKCTNVLLVQTLEKTGLKGE